MPWRGQHCNMEPGDPKPDPNPDPNWEGPPGLHSQGDKKAGMPAAAQEKKGTRGTSPMYAQALALGCLSRLPQCLP